MENKENFNHDIIDYGHFALSVLNKEIRAIEEAKNHLEMDSIIKALDSLLSTQGIVHITGSGTSSTIARRLAHTFTVSNLPSYYLDPGQCIHGYSKIVRHQDILIAFSRGGETDEVNFLAKIAKESGAIVISILENNQSTLAALSDIVITVTVHADNEPLKIIPLSSTIVQAAVGDILCAAVNQINDFDPDKFVKFHPGGAVGKEINL